HPPARVALPRRPRRAARRAAAADDGGALARVGPHGRAAERRALAARPGGAAEPAAGALFRRPVAADRARREPPHAAGADAARFRRQRLARTAHAADRRPWLPGDAQPGGTPGMGADARGDAAPVAAH